MRIGQGLIRFVDRVRNDGIFLTRRPIGSMRMVIGSVQRHQLFISHHNPLHACRCI